MTDHEFEALVARLDQQAQRDPAAYRFKVIALACAGYAYLALVLLVVAALFFGAIAAIPYAHALALKLMLVFGAFLWLVIGAMAVRLDPPKGRRLKRNEAPDLFALIDRLQRALRAPKFHEVLITEDFNAAVVQTPRLGLLGWYRNTLLIGLPLMKALTREQFAAVLAHEFGHLAGGHGRLGNWVYRLRLGWARLAHALEERQSAGSFLFRPFFKWYAPYFNAVSFPLARANEYEADAASARLTSSGAAAAALTNVNVIGSFLNSRFWPDLHRKADDVPQPSFAPYAQMGTVFTAGLDEAAVRGWLDQAMAHKTSIADTHPALADRLTALGEAPGLALPSAGEAADTLIGSAALQSITAAFDRRWCEQIEPSWMRRHSEVKAKREQLSALETRLAAGASLTLEERLWRAILTEEVGAGDEAAFAQFCELYTEAPDDDAVCFGLGKRLLAVGADGGVALIEQAIARNELALLAGAALLRDYHAQHGRADAAQHWHERWLHRVQVLQAAEAERSRIDLNDSFEPHGLDDQELASLRAQLRAIPNVYAAYLVRKRVTQLVDRPLLVLGVTTKPWSPWSDAALAKKVVEEIQSTVRFPHETFIMCVEGENRRFGRKFRSVRGAHLF